MSLLALDAMGGDFAPENPVRAAANWVNANRREIVLVGRENEIRGELAKHSHDPALIRVVHAEDKIEMDDNLGHALLRKKKSSLKVAFNLHKRGEVDGVISAGHSGAMMAIAKLTLKCVPGVERPCIGTMFPTKAKRKLLMADCGGNTECTPANLFQFAVCCGVYFESLHSVQNPTVALLNIGSEPGKGNELVRKAFDLFEQSDLNFAGNIEGKELFNGDIDIVICDGFVGNVVLKSVQGAASYLKFSVAREVEQLDFFRKIGLLAIKSKLKKIFENSSYEKYGGALLLGLKGNAIVCHGGSSVLALESALAFAERASNAKIHEKIELEISGHLDYLKSTPDAPKA